MVMKWRGGRGPLSRGLCVVVVVVSGLSAGCGGGESPATDARAAPGDSVSPSAAASASSSVTPRVKVSGAGSSTSTPHVPRVTATPVPGTKQDALFLEAKQVYEEFLEEVVRVNIAGGSRELTPGFRRTTSGEFQVVTEKGYAMFSDLGDKLDPQTAHFGSVTLRRVYSRGTSEIKIHSCVDMRPWVFVAKNSSTATPKASQKFKKNDLILRRESGVLKIDEGYSKRTATCDA